jgi:hypothetical protein
MCRQLDRSFLPRHAVDALDCLSSRRLRRVKGDLTPEKKLNPFYIS